MKKILGIAAICGLCISAPAHASDVRMDDVVISANKIETSASEVTSSVTVITEEDMEAKPSLLLSDTLKDIPGVFLSAQEGPGGMNGVSIRGSNANYTQYRFNGIPLRDATNIASTVDSFLGSFNLIPGSLSRIEVLKGAQSTLYGSSAMAGVVSMYTGNKYDSGFNASLDLSGGSYGSFNASGQISYGTDKYYVNFLPLYTTTEGHNDIWQNQGGFVLGAGIRFTEKTSLELTSMLSSFESASYTSPSYDFASKKWNPQRASDDDSTSTKGSFMLAGLTLNHEISDSWQMSAKVAMTRTDRKSRSWSPSTTYEGETYYTEWLNTFRPLDNLTFIAGVDYEGQAMETKSGSSKQDEDAGATSAYTKAMLTFLDKKLVFSAGGRINKATDFDTHGTWDIGTSYSFDTGTRIYGNVATGYRTPSLYQRYGDGEYVVANENLDPETSLSCELGVEQRLWGDKLLLNASLFSTEYEDQLNYAYLPDYSGYYYNADEAKARGFELGFSIQPHEIVRIDASYTHVSSKQKLGDSDWVHQSQMPDDRLSATLHLFPIDGLKLSLTGRWEDKRSVGMYNAATYSTEWVEEDSFFTVDIAATYDVTDHLQVYAKINNLLDEDYTVRGWEMPGINAMAGVRFKF